MQTTAKLYTDIDYESFPIADLDLDLHWIQLPNSVLAARRQAKLKALERRPRLLTQTEILRPRQIKNGDTNPAISFKRIISHLGKPGTNPTPANPAKGSTGCYLTIEFS